MKIKYIRNDYFQHSKNPRDICSFKIVTRRPRKRISFKRLHIGNSSIRHVFVQLTVNDRVGQEHTGRSEFKQFTIDLVEFFRLLRFGRI